MSDREIEIKDILIRDAMLSFLQTRCISATKIDSTEGSLLNIVSDIIDKNLKIKSGDKFIYKLSLKNIFIEHTSSLKEVGNKLQEDFIFTVSLLDDITAEKLARERIPPIRRKSYATSFHCQEEVERTYFKQMEVQALGPKFNDTDQLMQIRDIRIMRMKAQIYKAIMSLKGIVYE